MSLLIFFGGEEEAAATEAGVGGGSEILNIIVYLFLVGTLAATITVGILSAIAAAEIQQGKRGADDKGARRQAIIAAVLAISGSVLIIIALLVKIFYKPSSKTQETSDSLDKQLQQALLVKKVKKIKEEKKEKKEREIEPGTRGITITIPEEAETNPSHQDYDKVQKIKKLLAKFNQQ